MQGGSDTHHRRTGDPERLLALLIGVVVVLSGLSHPRTVAASPSSQESAAARTDGRWPATVEAALAVDLPVRVTAGQQAAARGFLKLVRRGHRLRPVRRKAGKNRSWLTAKERAELTERQFERLRLGKARFAVPQLRRLVRTAYADLARYGRAAFGLPSSAMPGVAALGFNAHDIASTLSNGSVFVSEREFLQYEDAAVLWARSRSQVEFLHGLMRAVIDAVVAKTPGKRAVARTTPRMMRDVRTMLAKTLAHEMTHAVQLVAYSLPHDDWSARERRHREMEADAGGTWIAACAGHPLEVILIDDIAAGIMDALARSQGVREKPYPPWEKRVPSAYKAIKRVRQLHARGSWPSACAPLSVDPERLLDRRLVLRWLKQISTPKGVKAAFAWTPQ